MNEKEMYNVESMVMEMFDSIIQDPIEKKILGLIIENKPPEEILEEMLYEETL